MVASGMAKATRGSDTNEKPGRRIGRRGVIQGLLTGVGAGVASASLPGTGFAGSHASSHRHPQATTAAVPEDGAPGFLDGYQMQMLESLAERIIPGAGEAGCARFLDSLLGVAAREDAQQFIMALGAIDAEARRLFRKPWVDLSEERQIELLEVVSSAAPGRPWAGYWTPGTPIAGYAAPAGTAPSELRPRVARDHFDLIKGKLIEVYYSALPGLWELGYTGPNFGGTFRGCTHQDGHRKG